MTSFTLKPSRCLSIVLIAAHVAAAALVLPLQLPVLAKGFLYLLMGLSLARSVWRYAWLRPHNVIIAARVTDRETATLLARDGTRREAKILDTSYVSPWLTVLNVRATGRWWPQHLIIVSDNIDRNDWRRLRVVLRWRSATRTDAPGGVA